jgi:hypothetical protein
VRGTVRFELDVPLLDDPDIVTFLDGLRVGSQDDPPDPVTPRTRRTRRSTGSPAG